MIYYEYEVTLIKKVVARFPEKPSMEKFRIWEDCVRKRKYDGLGVQYFKYTGPVDVPEQPDEIRSGEPDTLPQHNCQPKDSVESKSIQRRRSLQAAKPRKGKMGSGRRG